MAELTRHGDPAAEAWLQLMLAGAGRYDEANRWLRRHGRGLYAIAPVSHLIPFLRGMRMTIVSLRFAVADYRDGDSS